MLCLGVGTGPWKGEQQPGVSPPPPTCLSRGVGFDAAFLHPDTAWV